MDSRDKPLQRLLQLRSKLKLKQLNPSHSLTCNYISEITPEQDIVQVVWQGYYLDGLLRLGMQPSSPTVHFSFVSHTHSISGSLTPPLEWPQRSKVDYTLARIKEVYFSTIQENIKEYSDESGHSCLN